MFANWATWTLVVLLVVVLFVAYHLWKFFHNVDNPPGVDDYGFDNRTEKR